MTTPGTRKRPVTIPAVLTVKDLAGILGVSAVDVIKRLMTNGVMAAMNQSIDYEAAALVARECGFSPAAAPEEAPGNPASDSGADDDDPASLQERAPIVTILGHVDHGKTSLLDAIRETDVVSGEAGGITQHIGAYQVDVGGKPITFIDTPGHAAFTAMRARGAQITDIAVLVVAADDGVMPQTVEAINHAKAAGVPIVVAINKCDMPAANPDRVKQQLTEHELVVEDYGGDVVSIEVSATQRTGVSELLESVQLVAELEELKANPNRPATGVVVEAQLETKRGPIATVLVERGTLRQGDALIVGEIGGKVKAMFDYRGTRIREAGPSTPAVVMGISSVPDAGERFRVVENDKTARRIVEQRRRAREATEGSTDARVNLDTLFNEISTGAVKELILIVKADVRGSVEAIRAAVERLSQNEVKVKVIHSGTGPVNDSDVMLAQASDAIIVAFNTKIDASASRMAETAGIEIRSYEIIYQLLEDIEKALTGLFEPIYKTVIDGHAEVRQVFRSSRVGGIAGSYVLDGTIRRGLDARVLRNGEEIGKGRIESLRRFQDDVRDVQSGYECGITVSGFDRFEAGDVIEATHEERAN